MNVVYFLVQAGMGCLLFNSNTTLTWEEANIYCQEEENGTLLQIWNELQFEFIRMELGFLSDHVQVERWWTSGTDAGKEGTWQWASSLVPVGDFIWYPGQPQGDPYLNCLYLYQGSDFFGRDNTCSSNFAAICERK